jgi:hypothetical protein
VLVSFETLRHTLVLQVVKGLSGVLLLAIPDSTVLLGCSFTGTPLMCTLLGSAPSRFGGCRSPGLVGSGFLVCSLHASGRCDKMILDDT